MEIPHPPRAHVAPPSPSPAGAGTDPGRATGHHATLERGPSARLDALANREFPRVRGDGIAYLNNASTGPLPESALAVLADGNTRRAEPWRFESDEQFGILARGRELVARLIGATPREIALTVNTSYGLNLAARSLPLAPGDVVLGLDREYPTNIYPWKALEASRGIRFERLPVHGRVADEDALVAALDRPGVRAVVFSWVSFDTGARMDLQRIGAACRARGIWCVVDAIQGVGAVPLHVASLGIDILACGAQKWLASPWGTGFVYVRRELVTELVPTFVGWMAGRGSDDFTRMLEYDFAYRADARRFELVTLPYQDLAAMNAALEVFLEAGMEAIAERLAGHVDRIVAWAQDRDDLVLVTPPSPPRRAGIVSLVPRDPAAASARLRDAGVIHSLREGAIRLSPHWFTPAAHVERTLEVLSGVSR